MAVRDVFAAWQRVHGHPSAKLDAKRSTRIRRALTQFTPEQLEQALRGALLDDWLMGRDPKSPRKYDGLETLLRDTAQIERLIELERAPPSAPRSGRAWRSEQDERLQAQADRVRMLREQEADEERRGAAGGGA